jgi:putative (di)nucleoside polyphosphate hydrolase
MMVLNSENKIFVGRKLYGKKPVWLMPQGGIEGEEEPIVAALRELEEEIGTKRVKLIAESSQWLTYNLNPIDAKKLWNGKFSGQQQKWFAMRFIGNESDIALDLKSGEFQDWKWLTQDELLSLSGKTMETVYQKVFSEFWYIFNVGKK